MIASFPFLASFPLFYFSRFSSSVVTNAFFFFFVDYMLTEFLDSLHNDTLNGSPPSNYFTTLMTGSLAVLPKSIGGVDPSCFQISTVRFLSLFVVCCSLLLFLYILTWVHHFYCCSFFFSFL